MGTACCRCVQPASVQPRKTYNTLVGQLFSVLPIKTDDPIDSTMRRKIQKLQEYLQANPAKVPKASRRLMRKIKATLRKPGDNLGHVKVAVHTYAYLLAKSADDNSSYSPTFFLKELLTGPDAVVPLLLKDIHIEMRTLGAELLAVFTRVQSPVDSKLDSIQAHVLQVCRVAQGALRSDRKEQKLQETTERRRAGDKLAVPDPIYLIGRRDPAHVAALEVSCLHCLKEVVVLCRKNKVVPAQVHEIQAVMLDNLHASRGGTGTQSGGGAAAAADAAAVPIGAVDTAYYGAMGMQQFLPQGTHPREAAEQLLLQMASFTQDISMVDKILDSFYEYMDDRDRWQEAPVVKNFLWALGTGAGQHPYPIFASLLRHACSRKLPVADCAAVLQVARDQGVQLDEAYSLSALQLALEELPVAWAEQARRDPKGLFMKPFLELWRAGTAAMKDLAHIGESPTPGQHPSSGSQSGTPTAAGAAHGSATQPSAGGETPTAVRQQLAKLKLTMLQTVHALAGRVQTAAELCEVITGVMHAVAADLHCQGPTSPTRVQSAGGGFAAAVAAAATNGPADGFSSPFQPAAAVPPTVSFSGAGAGGATPNATGAAVDAGTLAVCSMALQLAAAAAEGCVGDLQQGELFMTPFSSFTGTAARGLHSSSGSGGHVPSGGVLPTKLVSAALPLLSHGSPVVRQAVQRILLTLLPAAPQGVATSQQAGQLAEAALLEQRQDKASPTADESSSQDDGAYAPAMLAGVDALLRGCLKGQQPHPGAVLAVARALLQQQEQWVKQQGYRSGGTGGAERALDALLLFNSQLAALADATHTPGLRSHQLPLEPQAHPSLQLTAMGLTPVLTSAAGATPARSSAALQALEQQQPPRQQQPDSLRADLLQVPVLVEAYGEQLPALLDSQRALRFSASGADADKPQQSQLTGRVSAQLPQRTATYSKGRLLHVSDLLQRNSMTRSQNLPPVMTLINSSPAHPQLAAAPAATADSAAASVQSKAMPVATVAEVSPAAAAAAAAGSSTLPSVSVIAAGSSRHAVPAANGVPVQAVSAQEVRLEVAGAGRQAGQGAPASLSAAVAAVLKQPAPAGAYVVRDIKISKLAGELDLQL